MTVIFESKLMVNVSQDMFADGHAVATAALKGDTMPAAAMAPKSLAAGSATSLLAALDPELSCKSPRPVPPRNLNASSILILRYMNSPCFFVVGC